MEIKKSVINHPRNERVVFDEKRHTYHVDGKRYQGVTGWIAEFCQPFNKWEIANKLADGRNPNWNQYTAEEIIGFWDDAREYGNYVDKLVEDYVNLGIDNGEKELQQFKDFLEEYNLTPVMAQWVVFNEHLERASALDVVCSNKNGEIVVIDLKTMEKEVDVVAYKNKKMSYPINLPESKYYKFCLQIGIYVRWIRELYDMKVSKTHYVLRIRPEFYQTIPILNVEDRIIKLEEFTK
jgi:hypothetical protein